MEKEREIPDVGETVVCKVRQVLGYGAFVELVEFGDKKGFVHVSQVASRWVKNIRNYVKEGQVRAAKVLSIDRARGQIDLSFNKVSSQAQRARIEEWKQLKRSKKLLDVLAKSEGKAFELAWESVAVPLLENYDSLGEAFQNIALLGAEGAEGVGKEWLKPLVELVQKSVPVPQKTLSGFLFARSLAPDGVDIIRGMLAGIEKSGGGNVKIFYSGGGKYDMRATAPDFKSAEKLLENSAEAAIKAMKASGGEARFEKGA
jgi:translation initiation factor 2 subunit 1